MSSLHRVHRRINVTTLRCFLDLSRCWRIRLIVSLPHPPHGDSCPCITWYLWTGQSTFRFFAFSAGSSFATRSLPPGFLFDLFNRSLCPALRLETARDTGACARPFPRSTRDADPLFESTWSSVSFGWSRSSTQERDRHGRFGRNCVERSPSTEEKIS